MAGSAVLAGVRLAVVHVQFAVLALEAFGALAGVGADQIFAGGAVLTGRGFALVYLLLAVRACVAVQTVAAVGVANVLASSVVTKELRSHT